MYFNNIMIEEEETESDVQGLHNNIVQFNYNGMYFS